jgi:hypothetical protein
MSLISQIDRKRAINALEYYLENVVKDNAPEKVMEYNALINWIKLDMSKHEH